MRVLSVVIAIIDNDFFVSVDRGVRFGVSLITLVFVSCGACFFFFFIYLLYFHNRLIVMLTVFFLL